MLASDVLNADKRRWARWAGAGALIIALHASGAAWAIYNPPEEEIDDEVAGAIVMELAPVTATQRAETPDSAIGPQAEEAVPTPPTTEKVEELKPLDIPQFEQSPLASEPEVALPVAKPVEEVQEKEEEIKEVQPENLAPQQTAAAQSMAPPQIQAKDAPVVTAQQIGDAKKNSKAILTYRKSLHLHLKKHQRYPSEARSRGQQGTVVIQFSIDRTGKMVEHSLQKSSGNPRLDEEALAAIERASPFPLPPDEEPGESLKYSMPIQFKIK
jgi:protein TonB